MKAIEHKKYDRYLFSICGIAGLLYGIDMGLIAAALPYIRATCDFTSGQVGLVVSAVLLGSIPGKVACTWVAEKFGRLRALQSTALVFLVAVPVICLSGGNFWMMFAGRLLQGMGCGFMGLSASLYMTECADQNMRGKGNGIIQLVLCFGLVLAALIGLSATHYFGSTDEVLKGLAKSLNAVDAMGEGDVAKLTLAQISANISAEQMAAWTHAWQTIFWVTILPTVILYVGTFRLRESPRWLYLKGREDEARASLEMNNPPEMVKKIMSDLETNRKAGMVHADKDAAGAQQETIFQRKYMFPFMLAVLIPFFTQASGVNSLLNYSVVLMQKAGLAGTSANLADTAIKVANFLMTFVAISLVDRKGRKFLLSIATTGIMIGLIAVGGLFLGLEKHWIASSPTTGWIIVGAFILFISSFAIGPGVCVWLAETELMPTRIRAKGMMLSGFTAMGASYLLAQTYLPWSEKFGNSSVFLTLAVISVFFFLTVVFLLPETKGKSLEEIEQYFSKK